MCVSLKLRNLSYCQICWLNNTEKRPQINRSKEDYRKKDDWECNVGLICSGQNLCQILAAWMKENVCLQKSGMNKGGGFEDVGSNVFSLPKDIIYQL